VVVDLRDAGEAQRMVRETAEHFGRLDILVNNAAVWPPGTVQSISMKHFDLSMAVNVRSPFVAAREAATRMQRTGGGRILNVSTAAALYPVPGMVAYGMAKIGLELLTLYHAAELNGSNIAVNCLRVDIPCRSAGYEANLGSLDTENFEPPELAAEAALSILRRPLEFTGRRLSLRELRDDTGVVTSRAPRPHEHPVFPTNVLVELEDEIDLENIGR
jgi:citronellol/citronellal dehydrogenase